MKQLIRRWLGIVDNSDILKRLDAIDDSLVHLRSDLSVTFFDEFDPRRQEMSKKLADKTIKRLKDEDLARRKTLGELG